VSEYVDSASEEGPAPGDDSTAPAPATPAGSSLDQAFAEHERLSELARPQAERSQDEQQPYEITEADREAQSQWEAEQQQRAAEYQQDLVDLGYGMAQEETAWQEGQEEALADAFSAIEEGEDPIVAADQLWSSAPEQVGEFLSVLETEDPEGAQQAASLLWGRYQDMLAQERNLALMAQTAELWRVATAQGELAQATGDAYSAELERARQLPEPEQQAAAHFLASLPLASTPSEARFATRLSRGPRSWPRRMRRPSC
jgi:hypothetical protein